MSTSQAGAQTEAARTAAAQRSWREAFDLFAAADSEEDLSASDLESWATAGYLLGHVENAISALTRASQLHGRADAWERMAVSMHWTIFMLLGRGEMAQVSGWMARAQPILERLPTASPGRGFFTCLAGFRHTAILGDFEEGHRLGSEAVEIGRQSGHSDLLVMALNVQGRSLLRMGHKQAGTAALDEAMLEIVSGGVSPIPAGTVYCSVIEACEEIADVRRAQEWTEALDAWCTAQGDMVTFTGRCLIHRSSILTRRGEWTDAVVEAHRACDRLSGAADEVSSGRAHYQLGELARMVGDHETAESEYRAASEWGHDPQPGLALLRMAQGNPGAAAAMMRRLDAEHAEDHKRAAFLPALVRVMIDVSALDDARRAASDLERIASTFGTECLRAESDRALGIVALATGDPAGALTILRRASAAWREVGAPFEDAQTRLLIARTCREIGDTDTADLEDDAARRMLESLGARIGTTSMVHTSDTHGLTPRELDVLQLVATGITNQDIADRLFVAVRTVDRHVGNILTKLGVPSRTAATAYAYEHGLI